MSQVGERDKVGEHLGGSWSVHTCCCCCTVEVLVVVLVDIDPSAHPVSMAFELLVPEQRYAPELEQLEPVQPVLFACSVPQLAVVAVYLERAND